MMKTLVLIRHAKSSWDDPFLPDRERPLNKRGKNDAPAMGRLLKSKGLKPDGMLCSPAKRALKTAKLIAEAIGYPKKQIEILEDIYASEREVLQNLVANLDDGLQTVFLVGHNPETTEFANYLTGGDIANVPTCGVVAVEFAADQWQQAMQQGGRLAFFERPPRNWSETPATDDIIGA